MPSSPSDGLQLTVVVPTLDEAPCIATVLEGLLLDTMYMIPSRPDVKKVVVNADVVRNKVPPLLVTRSSADLEDEAESA